MSREVRRVPLDWQHPTTTNEHWQFQQASRARRGDPESRLHPPHLRFVGLMDDYPDALADWEAEVASIRDRTGWDWAVTYHLTGYQGREDAEPVVHPFYVDERAVDVRDEDHLHELATSQKQAERPDPATYMPVWDVPADELGWCLYETVSEGTPVTPVFATAEELIDHLATVGQDWGQQPMRRSAAEALVGQGGSLGSMVVAGGTLYDSSTDADLLASALDEKRTGGGAS